MNYVLALLVVAAAALPKDERAKETYLTSLVRMASSWSGWPVSDDAFKHFDKFIVVAWSESPVTFMVISAVVVILAAIYWIVNDTRKKTFPFETFAKVHHPHAAADGVRQLLDNEDHFQNCVRDSKLGAAEYLNIKDLRTNPLGPSRTGYVFPEELNKWKIKPRWFGLFAVVPLVSAIEHVQAICSHTGLCSEEDLVAVCQKISPLRNHSGWDGFCTTIPNLEAAQNDEIADLEAKLDFEVAEARAADASAAEFVALVEQREWFEIERAATEFDAIVQAARNQSDEQVEAQFEVKKSKREKGLRAKLEIKLGAKAREDKIARLKKGLETAIKKTAGAQKAKGYAIRDARKAQVKAMEDEAKLKKIEATTKKTMDEDMIAILVASRKVKEKVLVVMENVRGDLKWNYLHEVEPASVSTEPRTCPEDFFENAKKLKEDAVLEWNTFNDNFSVKYLSRFRDGTDQYDQGCNYLLKFLEMTPKVLDNVARKWREPKTTVTDKLQFSNAEIALLQSILVEGLSNYVAALGNFGQLEVDCFVANGQAFKNANRAKDIRARFEEIQKNNGWPPIWRASRTGNVATGIAPIKETQAEDQTMCENDCWSEGNRDCSHIAFKMGETILTRKAVDATFWNSAVEAKYTTTTPSCKLFEGNLQFVEAARTSSPTVVRALQAPLRNGDITNQDLVKMIAKMDQVEHRWEGIKVPLRRMSVVVNVYKKTVASLIKTLETLQIKLPEHDIAKETKFDSTALQKLAQSINKLIKEEVKEIDKIVSMGQAQINDLYNQMTADNVKHLPSPDMGPENEKVKDDITD